MKYTKEEALEGVDSIFKRINDIIYNDLPDLCNKGDLGLNESHSIGYHLACVKDILEVYENKEDSQEE